MESFIRASASAINLHCKMPRVRGEPTSIKAARALIGQNPSLPTAAPRSLTADVGCPVEASADARQLLANLGRDHAVRAHGGARHQHFGCCAVTWPMRASAPSGCARSIARTRPAARGATKKTTLPSLATYTGSRPSSSHADCTSVRTGRLGSSISMPTPEDCRDLVQRGGQSAARGVAHGVNGIARPRRAPRRSCHSAPRNRSGSGFRIRAPRARS